MAGRDDPRFAVVFPVILKIKRAPENTRAASAKSMPWSFMVISRLLGSKVIFILIIVATIF